jgi:translation initiation factor 2A
MRNGIPGAGGGAPSATFSLAYDDTSKPGGRIRTVPGAPPGTVGARTVPPGAEFINTKVAGKNAKKRANKKAKAGEGGGAGGEEDGDGEGGGGGGGGQAAAGPSGRGGSGSGAAAAAAAGGVAALSVSGAGAGSGAGGGGGEGAEAGAKKLRALHKKLRQIQQLKERREAEGGQEEGRGVAAMHLTRCSTGV